jgi:Pvc16 N-terminal domain
MTRRPDAGAVATHLAIGAVAEAVSRLLAQSWHPSLVPGITPEFEVFHGKDFAAPMATGVSVFVYQAGVDDVQRTLPPREPNHKRPLPVRICLLLTAWAQDASTEHALLGWAMRAVADHPVLTSGFLNAAIAGVFANDETVELTPTTLTNDEIFQLWQCLPGDLQLSVPYVARVVRIESELVDLVAPPVVERDLEYGVLVP